MSMVSINECCQFIVILGLFFIIVLYFLLCPVKPVYKLQRNNGGIWGDLGCWSFYHLLVSWISFMKQKKWTCFRDTCEHTRVHEVSVESLLMSYDCAPHWIDGFFRSGILCISSCDCNPDPVGLRLVIDIHSEPKQLPVLHQALGYWWWAIGTIDIHGNLPNTVWPVLGRKRVVLR